MYYPKITIITPSFNQGQYIEQTILSVIQQGYPNLEYIIIDGGSTDNSVEIIKKYSEHLTYWISEKDNGQSNAINKGLRKATGQLFNWINSDDYFEKEAFFKIAKAYNENPSKKVFCFGLSHINKGEITPFNSVNNPSDELQCFCEPIITQQSTFYSINNVGLPFGELSQHLHYSMDYELWLRFMFLHGSEAIHLGTEKIAVFRLHDDSKTSSGSEHFLNDMANILYSLLLYEKNQSLAQLLAKRFVINPAYHFPVQIPENKLEMIDKMALYFLLKWCRFVYSKKDFQFAKKIIKEVDFSKFALTLPEKAFLGEMKKNTVSLFWLMFKLKRKLSNQLKP